MTVTAARTWLLWIAAVSLIAGAAVARGAGPYEDQPIPRSAGSDLSAPGSGAGGAAASAGWNLANVVVALAVVVAAIFAVRWAARKFYGVAAATNSSRALQIVGRWPVGPRQQLVLIQVGRRLILASSAGAQMSTLCEIADAQEVEQLLTQIESEKRQSLGGSFKALLAQAGKSLDTARAAPHEAGGEPTADALADTHARVHGLIDKVRSVTRQIQGA